MKKSLKTFKKEFIKLRKDFEPKEFFIYFFLYGIAPIFLTPIFNLGMFMAISYIDIAAMKQKIPEYLIDIVLIGRVFSVVYFLLSSIFYLLINKLIIKKMGKINILTFFLALLAPIAINHSIASFFCAISMLMRCAGVSIFSSLSIYIFPTFIILVSVGVHKYKAKNKYANIFGFFLVLLVIFAFSFSGAADDLKSFKDSMLRKSNGVLMADSLEGISFERIGILDSPITFEVVQGNDDRDDEGVLDDIKQEFGGAVKRNLIEEKQKFPENYPYPNDWYDSSYSNNFALDANYNSFDAFYIKIREVKDSKIGSFKSGY